MVEELAAGERAAGGLIGIGPVSLAPGQQDRFPAEGEEIDQRGKLLTVMHGHRPKVFQGLCNSYSYRR
jgi:hypothetical protein